MKAVSLLSGGLDSTLALKLMLCQNIEVSAVNFVTPFCTLDRGTDYWAGRQSDRLGVELKILRFGEEYLDIVKNPRFGYGSNMNPCIDCRILMLRSAKQFMEQVGASFIVTGEVLGQRPSSQRMDAFKLIDRECGLEGLILRPLSAKLLPVTVPEREGWVDREKLLGLRGRSRKPQFRLAKEYGIQEFSSPAGGCLLTDPGFARRLKELMDFSSAFGLNDVELLKLGRHFRLASAKAVVGRNEVENERLTELWREGDLCLEVEGYKGPKTIVRGVIVEGNILLAARITARYSDAPRSEVVRVNYNFFGNGKHGSVDVSAIEEHELKKIKIG